jgi:hypothetical protein
LTPRPDGSGILPTFGRWRQKCEPAARRPEQTVIASQRVGAKRRPMTGSAKQSGFRATGKELDRFVACAARNDESNVTHAYNWQRQNS